MNLASTLAIYAIICKEERKPFKFPGNNLMWNNVADQSAAKNNARFQVFVAERWREVKGEDGGAVFNIHDGDKIRFRDLWPKIGE